MSTSRKKHMQLLRWIVLNIALAGMLILTFMHGEQSIYGKIAWVVVWGISLTTIPAAFLIVVFGVASSKVQGKARDKFAEFSLGFPLWLNTAFDAAYCFGLVWLGWYVTSVVYLMHAILGTMAILMLQWVAEAIQSQDATKEIGQ